MTPKGCTPLLCLHGFGGSPEDFAPVLAQLPAHQVHCPWLYGHGPEGDALVPTDFDSEVDRLAALGHAHLGPRALLLGYSLGGRLALGLLARHRAWVAGALLLSTRLPLEDPEARRLRCIADQGWIDQLQHSTPTEFERAWNAQAIFQGRSKGSMPQAQRPFMHWHHPQGLAAALLALGLGNMPSYPSLGQGPLPPITIMAGARDPKFVALSLELQRGLMGSQRVIAKHSAHRLLTDQPAAVTAALLNLVSTTAAEHVR